MNKIKFVMAAALLTAAAACTQTGYDNSYAYNSGYYGNSNTYTSGYNYNNNANPFYSRSAAAAQRRPYGDQDRDGVRNRNDSDANGDGIPDFFRGSEAKRFPAGFRSPPGAGFFASACLQQIAVAPTRRHRRGLCWSPGIVPPKGGPSPVEGKDAQRQLARRRGPGDGYGGVR